MPDREKNSVSSPAKAVRYQPRSETSTPKANGYAVQMPVQEADPAIVTGIDLSGLPKLIFAAGRGKTGKTTLLRWIAEEAFLAGRGVVLADIDPTHAALSLYFEDVARPESDDPAGVRDWLLELLEFAASEKQSVVVDLGGGDTTLRTIVSEIPGICEALTEAGVAPVMFYVVGREPEDLTPALTLSSRGFAPKAQAVVMNEYARPAGSTRSKAFARLLASSAYAEVSQVAVPVYMPRLFAAEPIEEQHAGFRTAKLGLIDNTRRTAWLRKMDERFAGVKSWLP
jgi:hypothetical protein